MHENSQDADQARLRSERRAIEALYGAFNEKALELLDLALAADWEDIPPGAGQGLGPQEFKPLLRKLFIAFPDLAVEVEEVIHVPGRMAVRARMSGTHSGALFGIAGTGRHVSFAIHEFHAFEAGRINKTWHVEDWFAVFLQLGEFPPAAGARP